MRQHKEGFYPLPPVLQQLLIKTKPPLYSWGWIKNITLRGGCSFWSWVADAQCAVCNVNCFALAGSQVRFVKSALWYHGYTRPQLHGLPADGSRGSRELLLAFSWLLHPLRLLEQLLAHNRVRTGDETSVCTVSMVLSFHPALSTSHLQLCYPQGVMGAGVVPWQRSDFSFRKDLQGPASVFFLFSNLSVCRSSGFFLCIKLPPLPEFRDFYFQYWWGHSGGVQVGECLQSLCCWVLGSQTEQ